MLLSRPVCFHTQFYAARNAARVPKPAGAARARLTNPYSNLGLRSVDETERWILYFWISMKSRG